MPSQLIGQCDYLSRLVKSDHMGSHIQKYAAVVRVRSKRRITFVSAFVSFELIMYVTKIVHIFNTIPKEVPNSQKFSNAHYQCDTVFWLIMAALLNLIAQHIKTTILLRTALKTVLYEVEQINGTVEFKSPSYPSVRVTF